MRRVSTGSGLQLTLLRSGMETNWVSGYQDLCGSQCVWAVARAWWSWRNFSGRLASPRPTSFRNCSTGFAPVQVRPSKLRADASSERTVSRFARSTPSVAAVVNAAVSKSRRTQFGEQPKSPQKIALPLTHIHVLPVKSEFVTFLAI